MQLSEKWIMDPLGEWEVTPSLHNKKKSFTNAGKVTKQVLIQRKEMIPITYLNELY